jgi:hypothetical protein
LSGNFIGWQFQHSTAESEFDSTGKIVADPRLEESEFIREAANTQRIHLPER